jgi:hypothetical protein
MAPGGERAMLGHERRGAVAQQEVVGRVGSVTHRVRGGEHPGEIRVVVNGLPHHYLAFAPVALPVGAHVLVVGVRGPHQVDVESWER